MGENKNFEEQNKLPELKLGKIINVFVFFFAGLRNDLIS
jgi:hypothetical protein